MAPAKRQQPKEPATKDSTEPVGPDGEPVDQEAPKGDARGDSVPAKKTGQVDRDDQTQKQSPGRSRGRNPLPVWPD